MSETSKRKLTSDRQKELLSILRVRFEKNMNRHKGIEWVNVQAKLEANPVKLWSLSVMEETGGEPDVIAIEQKTKQARASKQEYVFYDCSAESPKDRRSLCYDQAAWETRKENKPQDSAVGMADAMGIELLSEEQYHELQKFGKLDTKTSSWVKTPADIRKLGGAIFCDFRYGHVFTYHNGAESYYAARGFRGALKV